MSSDLPYGSGPEGGTPGSNVPPPGWFPDPSGQHLARWWDGAAWTNHVQDAPPGQGPGSIGAGNGGVGRRPGGLALPLGIGAAVAVVAIVIIAALAGGGGPGPSAGTCLNWPVDAEADGGYIQLVERGFISEVSCDEPHRAEVLETISAASMERRGLMGRDDAREVCEDEFFEPYVGRSWEASALYIETDWLGDVRDAGNDGIVCYLFDGSIGWQEQRVGSLRGSQR